MGVKFARLIKLANYLDTVPGEEFDLESWGYETPCGFNGCAIGWAIHGKIVRGLKWAERGEPQYGEAFQWSAVREAFGIEKQEQAEQLFSMFAYPGLKATPKEVAERIRAFVAEAKS